MEDAASVIIVGLVSEFCRLLPTLDPNWTGVLEFLRESRLGSEC
jgi:hypothetical protein